MLRGWCQFSGSAEHGVTQFQVENVQAVIHSWPFARDPLGLRREAAIENFDFSCSQRSGKKSSWTGGLTVRIMSVST